MGSTGLFAGPDTVAVSLLSLKVGLGMLDDSWGKCSFELGFQGWTRPSDDKSLTIEVYYRSR